MRLDGVQNLLDTKSTDSVNLKLSMTEEELMDPNQGLYLNGVLNIQNTCGGTFIETQDGIFGTTDLSQHIEQIENILFEQQMNQEIE